MYTKRPVMNAINVKRCVIIALNRYLFEPYLKKVDVKWFVIFNPFDASAFSWIDVNWYIFNVNNNCTAIESRQSAAELTCGHTQVFNT